MQLVLLSPLLPTPHY
ncbi:hypothetical protein HU200_023740 [Digitaria exilis]|uniref:Uncharacterized protein n=1 Tax=Digitaria exilis TaxID=1010633 RepID=A0A835CBF9_9POAL|nr:hypothetical protein HU200_023740 [Digitaria exilis]